MLFMKSQMNDSNASVSDHHKGNVQFGDEVRWKMLPAMVIQF